LTWLEIGKLMVNEVGAELIAATLQFRYEWPWIGPRHLALGALVNEALFKNFVTSLACHKSHLFQDIVTGSWNPIEAVVVDNMLEHFVLATERLNCPLAVWHCTLFTFELKCIGWYERGHSLGTCGENTSFQLIVN